MDLAGQLFGLLSAGAALAASGAVGEVAKSGGKTAFEALKARIAGTHGVGGLDSLGKPAFAPAITSELDKPAIAEDAELARLAAPLRAAIEALPAPTRTAYGRRHQDHPLRRRPAVPQRRGGEGEDRRIDRPHDLRGREVAGKILGGAGSFAESAPHFHGTQIGTAHVGGNLTVNQITVETMLTVARAMGYRAPGDLTDLQELQERAERAEAEALALRRERPDLKAEVNRAIAAANLGNPAAAQAATAAA